MAEIAQRFIQAACSGNLTNDEHHFGVDVIMAVAMSSALGGLLFRVKYKNDQGSYKALLDHWTWIVSCIASKRHWPDHIPVDKVARESLQRWMDNRCRVCLGLGYSRPSSNTLHGVHKACHVCHGNGKQPLRADSRLHRYILDMEEELTAMEDKAGARAKKKLRTSAVTPQTKKAGLSHSKGVRYA
jgi:hypothetical protein